MRVFSMVAAVLGTLVWTGTGTAADLELGKKVYAAKCVMCHGLDGKGSAKMSGMLKVSIPDLTKAADRTEAELLKLLADGRQPMPSFAKSLSKPELEAVAHYAKNLASGQVPPK